MAARRLATGRRTVWGGRVLARLVGGMRGAWQSRRAQGRGDRRKAGCRNQAGHARAGSPAGLRWRRRRDHRRRRGGDHRRRRGRDRRRHGRGRLPGHERIEAEHRAALRMRGDCSSGFCADGYCCNESCSSGCSACDREGSEGTCSGRAMGDAPRHASDCKVAPSEPLWAGWDLRRRRELPQCPDRNSMRLRDPPGGRHRGGQRLRRHGQLPVGLSDKSFARRSRATSARAPATTRAPPNKPVRRPRLRPTGSCGKSPAGRPVRGQRRLRSGFCADGVCCNSRLPGAVRLVQAPRAPRDLLAGRPGRPRSARRSARTGIRRCRQNGLCDGVGGCSLYARGRSASSPSCSGNVLNMAATCDGIGACRMPGLQECYAVRCATRRRLHDGLPADSDCDAGIGCVNHSCGPKQNGQPCAAGERVQVGPVRRRSLLRERLHRRVPELRAASARSGKCTMVSAGNADPRATCRDGGATSCGRNGKCDGAGGCQLYAKGTTCKAESCASNVYTPVLSCDGVGRCVTPDVAPLQPLRLQRQQVLHRLHDGRAVPDAEPLRRAARAAVQQRGHLLGRQPVQERVLRAGRLLRQEPAPAPASRARSPARSGICTNVAPGRADPAGRLQGPGDGQLRNQREVPGGRLPEIRERHACADADLPERRGDVHGDLDLRRRRHLRHAGCAARASRYLCGTNACKAACTSNSRLRPRPPSASTARCGLKDNGRICASGDRVQVRLLAARASAARRTATAPASRAALASTAGTCSNVARRRQRSAGDLQGQRAAPAARTASATARAPASGTPAGTVCAAPTCPPGSLDPDERPDLRRRRDLQDGDDHRLRALRVQRDDQPATRRARPTRDCLAPGHLRSEDEPVRGASSARGRPAAATAECLTGLTCVDGVCCGSASCATCQACNVRGSPGTCTNVRPATAEPHAPLPARARPAATPARATAPAPASRGDRPWRAATATCSGADLHARRRTATDAGACAAPATMQLLALRLRRGACKTACTADGDCLSPFTCQGAAGTKSCALKPNGLACTAAGQCISGNCVDSVCCGSASCAACSACNI